MLLVDFYVITLCLFLPVVATRLTDAWCCLVLMVVVVDVVDVVDDVVDAVAVAAACWVLHGVGMFPPSI